MKSRSTLSFILIALAVITAAIAVYEFAGVTPRTAPPPKKKAPADTFPMTFKDDLGRTVTLDAAPFRIASLSPAITEILFTLGLGDKLVGTDNESDFPTGATFTSKLGTVDRPDMSAIGQASPQVVLSDAEPYKSDVIARHAKLIVLKVDNLDDLFRATKTIARFEGRQKIASELLRSWRARVAAARNNVKGKPIVSVYVELPPSDNSREINAGYLADLLRIVRAENVFPGNRFSFGPSPAPLMRRLKPDVILILDPKVTPDEIRHREGWETFVSGTSAARIYTTAEIDPQILLEPGPRGIDAIDRLVELLHPTGIGLPQ